jgi:hypothetical protein
VERLILRMLPADVRERHGDELADLLSCSKRPVRDRADVVVAGTGLRLGRALQPLLAVGVIGIVVFAVGVVYAVGNLRHGMRELPDHWWSTLIVCGFAGSSFAVFVLGAAQRRATAWRQRL